MTLTMKRRTNEVANAGVYGAAKSEATGTVRIKAAFSILVVAAVVFVAAGSYAVVRGYDARIQVRDQLRAEHIVTPEDAAIPNVPVEDATTAMAQADIIQKHMLEATGGKTYAQLDREDPLRQTAFSGSALRSSLMAAVLAWETANLAMGFGAFVAGIGLLLGFVLILLRPKFKTA